MDKSLFGLLQALNILAAIIIGSGVAAAVLTILSGEMKIFPLTLVFIVLPSAGLGIPAYLILKSVGRANWWAAAAAGFFVGAIIPAILALGRPGADEASVGGVPTVVNGSYTWVGWTQALTLVAGFGLLGIIGSFAFYFALSRGQQQGFADTELKSHKWWRKYLLMPAAVCVVIAAFAVSEASKDRSCHNPLRGGGHSISSVASFDVKVGPDQWTRAERIIHDFGAKHGWDIRSDVRPNDDFKWFQMSLCREPGTQIAVQGYVEFGAVSVAVIQPQGGDSWRQPFAGLLDRMEAAFPEAIAFQGPTGEKINRPNWAPPAKRKAELPSK